MNIERHKKQEIASQQLETALLLYFAKRGLFSVITLAGAAEEILGQLLQQRSGEKESRFRSVLNLLRPAKASTRDEAASGHETELFVHMDVRHEAEFLLGRAIDDYHALTGELSVNMRRFNEEIRSLRG